MHHLLERQLKKIFGDNYKTTPEWDALLKVVSVTYENYDNDRLLLERSFDISSKEFSELNSKVLRLLEELNIEKESIERKVVERTHELKDKVEELALANNRLLELDKVKTEFISVAAHQLRTPLAAIKWTLSSIIDEDSTNLNADQLSLITTGYESTERVINLVNDMLVVTRIESGKIQYNFVMLHIEDLIVSVITDFNNATKARGVELIFDRPKVQLPYVSADVEKIRGVVQNLIENALNYTKEGGKVTVIAEVEGGMVKISVKDNGIGIPESQQSSIFNKFFRAENAVRVRTDGSGLGLFIAKNVVERHGGGISFKSTVGKGTTFCFTLPIPDKAAVSAALDSEHV